MHACNCTACISFVHEAIWPSKSREAIAAVIKWSVVLWLARAWRVVLTIGQAGDRADDLFNQIGYATVSTRTKRFHAHATVIIAVTYRPVYSRCTSVAYADAGWRSEGRRSSITVFCCCSFVVVSLAFVPLPSVDRREVTLLVSALGQPSVTLLRPRRRSIDTLSNVFVLSLSNTFAPIDDIFFVRWVHLIKISS